MFGVIRRDGRRSRDRRILRGALLRPLDAGLDFPDRGQVLVDLVPVRRADARRQALRLLDGPIEDALAVARPPRGRFR